MSKKQGVPTKIGGLEVYPMNRSVKHELGLQNGNIEATLHAISTPGEELIDLQDLISGPFKTTDDILEPNNGPKKSDTRLRQELRPKERGLLMIYPLQSNTEMTEEEYSKSRLQVATSFPLRGAGQLFGFSLVFPKARAEVGQMRYQKNGTV